MLLSISFRRYNNSIIERAQAPTIFDGNGSNGMAATAERQRRNGYVRMETAL